MKKLLRTLSVVLGAVMLFAFAACGDSPSDKTDRGTLTVEDISLSVGESKTVTPVFSKEEYAEEVSYRFTGTAIEIAGNTVTGKKEGVVQVTAHTEHLRTTFKVTVSKPVVSEMVVSAPPVYVGYPARPISVKFVGEHTDENVTYTVESAYADKVFVEDGAVRAVGTRQDFQTSYDFGKNEGTKVQITAKTSEFETEFDVYVSYFDGANWVGGPSGSLNMESRSQGFLQTYESKGGKEGAVLFIGDSFFDPRDFWINFYTSLAGKNAFCFGVSSATTPDWELLSERLVYPLKPSAVVIHCGTNNIFDDKANAATATADIERLIGNLLENTEAKVYYFGIEPRKGSNDAYGNEEAKKCNTSVKAWCDKQARVTYLDSPAFCYTTNGAIDAGFYRDDVHPTLANYARYLNALTEAGVTYDTVSGSRTIPDISGTKDQSLSANCREILYCGKLLTDNYVLDGKVDITDFDGNAHFSFSFDNTNFGNRYLLWDGDSDGTFGLGWAKNGNHVNENATGIEPKFTFTAGSTLTIEFRIVVKNGTASFWLGDGEGHFTQKDTFENVPKADGLRLGMEKATGRFYDLKACTLADDPAEFAQKTA